MIVTVTESLAWFTASYAVAAITCEPGASVAAVVNVYGDVEDVPTTAPSTEKSTRITP